ncbi:hypothetical protein KSZ_71530 [Dictyobacter formicarum]|uniref:Acyl-CoA dehydrogenase/oxidase C-terminal domain-containing protein n=2 Tax=Dictyobacter formicarum TaxID=2778368 RepID=A0ABQ3VS83_9CHLR|nr:hypothetical protein KSZ_71530 [Dictyobacter formicarum]
MRDQVTLQNRQLAETVSQAGVITSRDFAIFQDHGCRELYGGLGAQDIHVRKGLKKSQKILDYMGGTELAANFFVSCRQMKVSSVKELKRSSKPIMNIIVWGARCASL